MTDFDCFTVHVSRWRAHTLQHLLTMQPIYCPFIPINAGVDACANASFKHDESRRQSYEQSGTFALFYLLFVLVALID
jgi:hypothetical protein